MPDSIKVAQSRLLEPTGLNDATLLKLMGNVLGHAVDGADLYFQTTTSESWYLEDGRVKEGSFDVDQGMGVRAISGEKTGFAYTDDLTLSALESATKAAKTIARSGQSGHLKVFSPSHGLDLYQPIKPQASLSSDDKVKLLQDIDAYVRAKDPHVKQVFVSLAGVHDIILMVNSEGNMSADIRPLVRLNVSIMVEKNGRRETGSCGGGGRFAYDYFLEDSRAFEYADDALKQALTNLDADPAPAGEMTVVLGPGWPGVLLHEAIGHGLEGDFNRKETSAFSGKIGQRVAAPGVTVVDDGTIENRRGSLNIDDEGTPTECTVLIEDGILKNYMQDKLNAKLMKMKPTGNGRRESYAYTPMPRMTNTYMLAGQYDPNEIIASVDKGLYAVNFGGGQVDITSGKFVFSASEAFLIEKGKVTKPVRGATIIGNGPDVLTRVSMVGNDLQLDKGVGTCGKDGQQVPVGVGQPTLKIDNITVGGTETE